MACGPGHTADGRSPADRRVQRRRLADVAGRRGHRVRCPGAGADGLWLAEQRAAYAHGPLAAYGDELEAAAREALGRRRAGIDTSLYFRPTTMPMTGVLHATLRALPEGVDAEAVASESIDWMLPEEALLGDPVVEEFETVLPPEDLAFEHISRRAEYVSRHRVFEIQRIDRFRRAARRDVHERR